MREEVVMEVMVERWYRLHQNEVRLCFWIAAAAWRSTTEARLRSMRDIWPPTFSRGDLSKTWKDDKVLTHGNSILPDILEDAGKAKVSFKVDLAYAELHHKLGIYSSAHCHSTEHQAFARVLHTLNVCQQN